MTDNSGAKTALPEPSRDKHSLFVMTAPAANSWLQTLPRANLGETTKQLYLALSELNQVKCKGKDRLDLLEAFRPDIHAAVRGLSQHYLGKPINLPEKVEKIVSLADTLNKQLILGYQLAFRSLPQESRLLKPTDAMAKCLHRIIAEQSRILLRTYQLHRSPATGFWLKLHHLFQLAREHKLLKIKIADPHYGGGRIGEAYKRALLLSCCRPHQIPQRFLAGIFDELHKLAGLAELRHERLESCVFLLDPDADQPPQYRELVSRAPSEDWLGIDTKPLTTLGSDELFASNSQVPSLLQERILLAWASAAARSSERQLCDIPARLVVGLGACHYFLAEEMGFDAFKIDSHAAESSPDPFVERTHSQPWDDSPAVESHHSVDKQHWNFGYKRGDELETINYSLPSDSVSTQTAHTEFSYVESRILDISDTGYRIGWSAPSNSKLRNGEIIALSPNENADWSLAAVRWIRNEENFQIGAELLATQAIPYSIRVLQAGLPSTDYQRALLISGSAGHREPSVLVPALSIFRKGQSVELLRPGHALKARLVEALEEGNAFKVFKLDEFGSVKKKDEHSTPRIRKEQDDGQFGQIWDVL